MSDTRKLIVDTQWWVESLCSTIDDSKYVYENTDSYSLLNIPFNIKEKRRNGFHMIHLEIPEYGFHITLIPDDYIQFHRRKDNGWGTRVSYGSFYDHSTCREFYLDRSFPWYICPIIDHEQGILRIYMFKYEDNETNPIDYFAREYMRQRGMKPYGPKDAFVYKGGPTVTDVKKRYDEISFDKLQNHIDVGHGPTINVNDPLLKAFYNAFGDKDMRSIIVEIIRNVQNKES